MAPKACLSGVQSQCIRLMTLSRMNMISMSKLDMSSIKNGSTPMMANLLRNASIVTKTFSLSKNMRICAALYQSQAKLILCWSNRCSNMNINRSSPLSPSQTQVNRSYLRLAAALIALSHPWYTLISIKLSWTCVSRKNFHSICVTCMKTLEKPRQSSRSNPVEEEVELTRKVKDSGKKLLKNGSNRLKTQLYVPMTDQVVLHLLPLLSQIIRKN